MIKNPSASATIPDGSILNIKLADATISSAKLDASLNALINAGSVGEGSITSFHIATGSILGTDICGNTITYANIAHDAVTNTKIANGAVTHAKLSTDCVQSHNILDGTILGTDISGLTITGSNIADNTITYNKLIPFGIIRIVNESPTDTNFSYQLGVFNAIDEEYDGLAFVDVIKQNQSVSHFYQTPFNVNMKLIVGNDGGIGVQSFNILQGATQVSEEGNELIFKIDTTDTKYQNIEIGVDVAI
jgi:hypothetical protein